MVQIKEGYFCVRRVFGKGLFQVLTLVIVTLFFNWCMSWNHVFCSTVWHTPTITYVPNPKALYLKDMCWCSFISFASWFQRRPWSCGWFFLSRSSWISCTCQTPREKSRKLSQRSLSTHQLHRRSKSARTRDGCNKKNTLSKHDYISVLNELSWTVQ